MTMEMFPSREIREARPKLITVSPLVSSIIIGLALFDLAIAAGFAIYPQTSVNRLAVVNEIVTLNVYSVIFALLGVSLIMSYLLNAWNLIKFFLVMNLLLKSIWFYALVVITIRGGSPILLAQWGLIAYIEAAAYIHFLPPRFLVDTHGK